MSDNWIVLIPEDPNACLDGDRLERAVARLRQFAPDAEETTFTASQQPQFFDCGENLERIVCPSCGRDISAEWFQHRMDADYEGVGFRLDAYRTPCCDNSHTLDELHFEWPQGFAKCSVELMNPNIGRLTDSQRQEIESILGVALRVIHQHI